MFLVILKFSFYGDPQEVTYSICSKVLNTIAIVHIDCFLHTGLYELHTRCMNSGHWPHSFQGRAAETVMIISIIVSVFLYFQCVSIYLVVST